MSNQDENGKQQAPTSEELRQSILTQLEASGQSIEELSDEELEGVAGGGFLHFLKSVGKESVQLAGDGAKVATSLLMRL
jgi:hypothetical protein